MALALATAQRKEEDGQEINHVVNALLATDAGSCSSAQAHSHAKVHRKEEDGREDNVVMSTLLKAEESSGSSVQADRDMLPAGYIVVLTQVLPDGMGDLIFGENAVHELMEVAGVAWLRCYTNSDSVAAGEHLVEQTASKVCFSLACSNVDGLQGAISSDRLERLWADARERFLAPWIFGLSAHEEALLQLAQRTGRPFWALTEYGRSMGNIHTYTAGLGSMIPTGWTLNPEEGGVFRSILRAPLTETNWRGVAAEWCGLPSSSNIRLWWFYSRKDDEKKHSFRVLSQDQCGSAGDGAAPRRKMAKVVPMDATGNIALTNEKTSGEKLADQLFQAVSDPSFKPTADVACAEVAAGGAGQLSQFLWAILFSPTLAGGSGAERLHHEAEPIDIVVAPNVMTQWREESGSGCVVAEITQLDLVKPDGSQKESPLPAGRRLLVCSAKVPRSEMRRFLEQCEEHVFTTGDQSLAEAMFMGKLPCIKPDAKVQQWQIALLARSAGALETTPDLGQRLRQLVADAAERDATRSSSKRRSEEIEAQIVAQLGVGPNLWTPTHHVLARAGMLG